MEREGLTKCFFKQYSFVTYYFARIPKRRWTGDQTCWSRKCWSNTSNEPPSTVRFLDSVSGTTVGDFSEFGKVERKRERERERERERFPRPIWRTSGQQVASGNETPSRVGFDNKQELERAAQLSGYTAQLGSISLIYRRKSIRGNLTVN